jgi:SAM-dependent methyltransferase
MSTDRETRAGCCRICDGDLGGPVLALGDLPPCNRFSRTSWEPEVRPLDVVACPACGLIQLLAAPPLDFVRPRLPWIRYNEPDGHLAELAASLAETSARPDGSALGVGPFDGPLLASLSQRGFRSVGLDLLAGDPPLPGFTPYLETFQDRLRPDTLAAAAGPYGAADIVVCRYLLEHCHAPMAAFEALGGLLADDGLLVIEVPDSSKFLARLDYSFLWEEHVSYFMQETLLRAATRAGFAVERLHRYEGALEDALVAVLRRSGTAAEGAAVGAQQVRSQAFDAYRSAFPRTRDLYRARVAALAAGGARIALIGVGHQAIMLVNAMGLQPSIALMVDDDPNKQGCFAPGVAVRIASSAALLQDAGVIACLLAASPRAEVKIREKLAPLTARGVRMYPLSAGAGRRTILDDLA